MIRRAHGPTPPKPQTPICMKVRNSSRRLGTTAGLSSAATRSLAPASPRVVSSGTARMVVNAGSPGLPATPLSLTEPARPRYSVSSGNATYGGRRGDGMAILTRDEIIRRVRAGEIGVDPFDEQMVGPASIDLHLANQFRVFKRVREIFHVTEEAVYEDVSEIIEVGDDDYFVLMPGETC